jgi:hypothetical protein
MANEFDLPVVGLQKEEKPSSVTQGTGSSKVQVTSAPADLEPTATLEQQTAAAIPLEKSEFDLPVTKPPATFKYQDDPTIQRVRGTPEERAAGKEKEVPFTELYTKPENLSIIRDYATARFGKSGEQKKDESDEDYAKRFMTAMRQVEWNTSLNAIPELNWLSNAKEADVIKAARAHNLYEAVPSWYSTGGQPGIRPFGEAVLSAISEPTNIVSAGIGAGARYAVAREAIKNVLSSKLKAIGVAGTAEAVIGAGQNVIDQSVKRKVGTQRDELELTQLAIASGLSAFGGVLETGTSIISKGSITTKQELENILAGKKTKAKADPATDELNKAFDKSQEQLLNEFDIFEGRKTLDALSPPTDLTQAQIRTDINRKAIDVAKYIMLLSPDLRPASGQKVSDAVKNIFMSMDNIDSDVIDAALSKANLTPIEFAQATRTTVADAANVMQGYSALARTLKKVSSLDPEAEKLVQELYGQNNEYTTMTGNFLRVINRLERESKALVVSGIGTTVRNVLGTGTNITFDAASKIIEGTIYTTGKAITGVVTGDYTKGDITRGITDTLRDSFTTLGNMTNSGLTAETVDLILKDNPRLQNQLFSALQESNTADLSKVARVANTLNVAQDAFFRRSIFAASVERQLRRVGVDMYEILANNKSIPPDVLKNAADETLKATFSYAPKQQKTGQVSLEAQAEGLAHNFVKFFENVPGGSLAVTFPRFMSNAIAFQYRYSPLGATSGASDIASGAAKLAKGEDGGQAQLNKGLDSLSKGTVGTAAIYAAYKYRLENQDGEWYNMTNEDGSTVDIRGVFPIGPYMAVGDFLAKQKLNRASDAKLTELATTIIGMKLPAGSQASMIDELPNIIAGTEGQATERVGKAVGRLVGDFVGRFTTPGKSVFEFLDLFDEQAQIARDPNVVEGQGEFFKTAQQAAVQRVMAKLPGLKEDLPEFQPYFSDKAPVRAGEFFNSLSGVRVVPEKNLIEREFVKLKLDPYAFFGSTGDKVYDRAFIKESVALVERRTTDLINSERYAGFTLDQKRLAMATNIQETLSITREITQAKMLGSDRDRVNKMRFNKLPPVARRAINELYAAENDGKTMDQNKDYGQVYRYEAMIQRYR